jgi:ribosome biogenesis GTPase A
MAIQWYPGHMTKARRVIAESLSSQDVVIEVLDARMPRASANPVVTELRRHKPCVKILSKSDLADPKVTEAWIREIEAAPQRGVGDGLLSGKVLAVALSSSKPAEARTKVSDLCKLLVPHRGGPGKPVRALIVGIPNVGKSTLVNTLSNRKLAKVGDEPAVTKAAQICVLPSGLVLTDNPGIMWPKIEDEAAGQRLAFGGAIPDSALDYESVALFGAGVLLERYADLVAARFKLPEIPASAADLLVEIGKRRGGLQRLGRIDMHKAADVLIHEFRTGKIGRISLESP